jgi:sulfur-oxidizing protein SoxY
MPSDPVTRRGFLLAGTAVGLGALSVGIDGALAASDVDDAGAPPALTLPQLTQNGAKVPITVEMAHPMETQHHVTTVRVVNDRDPIPLKGEFQFTPANGQVYLAFQARLDDGRSMVQAAAECSRGRRWSSTRPTQVASDGGGCADSAVPEAREPDGRAPAIRLPQVLRGAPIAPGQIVDVQVKLKHPVSTGLGLRGGRWVTVSEPFYLTTMDVFYADRRVSRFLMTPALSDDPLITFRLRPLDAVYPIRFG